MTRVWRRAWAAATLLAAVWAITVWVTDGWVFSWGPLHVSSRSPVPALVVSLLCACGYGLLSNRSRWREDALDLVALFPPSRLAAILAFTVFAVALAHNSWTASGADAYSYVTQADLWLRGDLRIPIPIAKAVPWPDGLSTFLPFGYAATPDQNAIVPVTGPGLPLLMAALKLAGGHSAMFWVVPLSAALLVWVTFIIGRDVNGRSIGLAAAWLVATSPVFLMMMRVPMSDVPAATFWALAMMFTLRGSARQTAAAGLSAAVAILIRPNLAPLGAVFALWILWRYHRDGMRMAATRLVQFAAGVVAAGVVVAWLNTTLYGGPLSSGYSGGIGLFSFAHVPTNLARYSAWLIQSQTPFMFAGMLALAIPSRTLWPNAKSWRGRVLLASVVLGVWAAYLAYVPFDAWWFLRFLLPCWPAIAIGTAALILRPLEQRGLVVRLAGGALIVALGVSGMLFARRHQVFPVGEGERRSATIAGLVQGLTEPSAVIFTTEHSGTIRYYAGRLTLRFDVLNEAWLDRAAEWLNAAGRHPYFLIEDWELPAFRQRFAANNRLGRLDLSPVLAYQAYRTPGTIYLFDPFRPDAQTEQPLPVRDPSPLCVLPARPPSYDVISGGWEGAKSSR